MEKTEPTAGQKTKRFSTNLALIVILAFSLAINFYFFWFMYDYAKSEKYDISTDRYFFGHSGKRICQQLEANGWFADHPKAKDTCDLIKAEF